MNLLLSFISLIICFSTILLIEKLFKKEGLVIWISVATIIANIVVCKMINVFGYVFSLGNIMFASNFLVTDILTEKYGKEEAKKAINYALVFMIIFVVATQIAILFEPDATDLVNDSMKNLFAINLRTSISSMTMFYISNRLDIILFDTIKNKVSDKLWLRNNVATILSNCIENYLFVFFAFVGILDIGTVLMVATTTSVIEIIIAILDTPFIYLSKYMNKTEK